MTDYVLYPTVQRFLKPLSDDDKSKVSDSLILLEKFGRLLPPPDSKKVSRELFELRIRASVQIRLLYGFSGNTALIVHGFIKKTEKILPRDIRLAERRLRTLAS